MIAATLLVFFMLLGWILLDAANKRETHPWWIYPLAALFVQFCIAVPLGLVYLAWRFCP